MIKLKELLFEKVAHTKKSLEWVSMDYIPMTPKTMKEIMGDTPITVFHNLNPDSIKNKLSKVVGKKKSISTYTTDTEGHLSVGGGVQTGGGVVLEVEGKVLVAGTEDLGSVPDEAGRRWIHPNTFGKIVGMKQFEGGGGSGGASAPQQIQVGKRSNKIDTSRGAGSGELAYLRGEKGIGTSAQNFTPTGGAAGMIKNYAVGGIVVGEQGPELLKPTGSGYEVVPNEAMGGGTTNANFVINAVDAVGVEEVLTNQRGNIISMIREAAHDHGEEFIEAVDTNAYGDASTANTWTGKGGG